MDLLPTRFQFPLLSQSFTLLSFCDRVVGRLRQLSLQPPLTSLTPTKMGSSPERRSCQRSNWWVPRWQALVKLCWNVLESCFQWWFWMAKCVFFVVNSLESAECRSSKTSCRRHKYGKCQLDSYSLGVTDEDLFFNAAWTPFFTRRFKTRPVAPWWKRLSKQSWQSGTECIAWTIDTAGVHQRTSVWFSKQK